MSRAYKQAILENTGTGAFILRMPFDPMVIGQFKVDVPSFEREYNPASKTWTFDGSRLQYIIKLLESAGYELEGNAMRGVVGQRGVVCETIRVNYLGNARKRQGGEVTASAMDERGNWSFLFPFAVLAAWFDLPDIANSPLSASNLYEMFGVGQAATDSEIKSAYRRLMRTWHPDVNDDPLAAEVFCAVQDGYAVLTDAQRRGRYNVGLALAPQVKKQGGKQDEIVWVPPNHSRCGYLDVEMETGLRTSIIRAIYDWQDIINTQGRQLVSKWNASRNEPEYDWI